MERIRKFLIKNLVKIRNKRVSHLLNHKVNKISLTESYKLDREVVKLHRQKWGEIYNRKINPKWQLWYAYSTGNISPDFVPESIYYTIIEPILNNEELGRPYSDKNFYDLFYPEELFPETILRNIDGLFLTKDYTPISITDDESILAFLHGIDQFVVKPSIDSGGGDNIKFFGLNNGNYINSEGEILTFKKLNQYFKKDYLIQTALHQHPFLAQFNKTSVNTIKVLTYRSPVTNIIKILHFILRIGAKDQRVDNSRAGGFSIGVCDDGKLNKYAFTKDGKKFTKINDVNLEANKLIIPYFARIKMTAIAIAERNIHHRLLGLDMTIDNENNIRCIEVNNYGHEINFYQLNNGTLFGEFTDEVIEYCKNNMGRLYSYYIL